MKIFFELWIIFGIFAFLYLIIETWQYAVRKIDKDTRLYDHLVIMWNDFKVSDIKHLLLLFAGGPISLIIVILVIRREGKKFTKEYDL